MKTRLTPTSLANFLDLLPNEVGDILDGVEDRRAKKCIPLVLNSLRDLTNDLYGYLPTGEREGVLTSCATWLDLGMLIGAAPHKFAELLVEAQAKVVNLDDDNGS